MVDIERLDRALTWIEEHPEQHDQGVWVRDAADGRVDCGTAMCLAGWVVAQAHPDALFVKDDIDDMTPGAVYSTVKIGDGVTVSVEHLAQQLLGVTSAQGAALFAADNALDHLKAMRDILAEEPEASGATLEAVHGDEEDWYYERDGE